MTHRPTALMITPVIPAPGGNGLQMRAAMTLKALAHHYSVTLLVHQQYPSASGSILHPEVAALCHSAVLGGLGARHPSPGWAPEITEESFDLLHYFRLATIEPGRGWIGSAGSVHLDLDDVESSSRLAIAALFRSHAELAAAFHEEQLAARAMQQEIDALQSFDRVYVCSPGDIDLLPLCDAAEIRVLPNAIEAPAISTIRDVAEPFTFLFIGTLGYFPNEDGLRYFVDEVLPHLRIAATRPFRVKIVGHASDRVRRFTKHPEVDVAGFLPSLDAVYAEAGAVIVPLRAGGGTRIKVLEAAAYRVPIVSTAIGVEGIAMRHDEHCLIATDPREFAAACLKLMEDPGLGARLTTAAHELVSTRYALDAMIEAMAP